jgi:hypothetical protein
MSAIEMTIEERVAALEQSVAEMRQSAAEQPVKPAKAPKAPKAKKEAAEGGSDAAPRAPSAWNLFVSQTVAEMKQSGWESWTDLKGVVWPGSKRMEVKGSEQYVYDGGEHDGKQPSPALGGMVRASVLKAQNDPVAKAKAKGYHAKLAEKRSNASTGSGAREEPVADALEAGAKKGGRPKMTEEQKAAAKAKRDAKKAAAAAAVVSEEAEMAAEEEAAFEDVEEEDGAQTPVAAPPKAAVGGSAAPAAPKKAAATETPKKAAAAPETPAAPKKAASKKAAAAAKKVDLSLYRWSLDGKDYYTNDRKDVVDCVTGEWIGRFNGVAIDESIPQPADMEDCGMRAE